MSLKDLKVGSFHPQSALKLVPFWQSSRSMDSRSTKLESVHSVADLFGADHEADPSHQLASCEHLGTALAFEHEQGFHVSVDLPGVKADTIKIEAYKGSLRISAKRAVRGELGTNTYKFSQTLPFDERIADMSRVHASLDDSGMLLIAIPKKGQTSSIARTSGPDDVVQLRIEGADSKAELMAERKKNRLWHTMHIPLQVQLSDLTVEYHKIDRLVIVHNHNRRPTAAGPHQPEIRRVFSAQSIDAATLKAILMVDRTLIITGHSQRAQQVPVLKPRTGGMLAAADRCTPNLSSGKLVAATAA